MAAGHIVNGVQVWEYPTERVVCKNEIKGNGMRLRDEPFAIIVKMVDGDGLPYFDVYWANYAANPQNEGPQRSNTHVGLGTLEQAQEAVTMAHPVPYAIAFIAGGVGDVWSAFEVAGFN